MSQNTRTSKVFWTFKALKMAWHRYTHWEHRALRAVAHYHRSQCPDQHGHWAYEGQHFWLRGIHTSDKNGNACITGTTNFKISFKIWLLMHMMPYTGKVPWPSSATLVGLGGGGGGCDKLAIDKGGNLPEKVENHWSNIIHQMSRSPTQALAEYQITTGTIDPPGGATDTALRSTEVPKALFTTILILPKLFICKLL